MNDSQATATEPAVKHQALVLTMNNVTIQGAYRKKCDEEKLPCVIAKDFVMRDTCKTVNVLLDMYSTGQCLKRDVIEKLFEELGALSAPGARIMASQVSIQSTAVPEVNAWSAARLLMDAAMNEENRMDASPNDPQYRDARIGVVELGGSVKISKL